MGRLTRAAVLALAGCASCAWVAGLEDKEPRPVEAGAPDDAGRADASDAASAADTDRPPNAGEIVASGQAGPYGVVADDTFVYWSNEDDGTIARRAKSLASGVETIVRGQSGPRTMLIDGAYVYWSADNDPPAVDGGDDVDVPFIARTRRSDPGAVDDLKRGTGISPVRCMGLFAGPLPEGGVDDLIFVGYDDEIRRSQRDGTSVRDVSTTDTVAAPVAISVDETWVYWINQETKQVYRRAKRFEEIGNPPPEPVGTALPATSTIADMELGGRNLFFITQGGAIFSINPDAEAGGPVQIGQSAPGSRSLAVSRGKLYFTRWTSGHDGQVLAAGANTGAPVVIAEGLDRPRDVFVDVTPGDVAMVYWTNGDGTVRRAPAP